MYILTTMSTFYFLKVLFLSFTCIFHAVDVLSECHSGSIMFNASLATKTPYRFVANRDDSTPSYEGTDLIFIFFICLNALL